MMTTLREAAQQALEALEKCTKHLPVHFDSHFEAIAALKAALAEHFCDTRCTWADHAPGCVRAEPVQEPVAWMHVPHPDNGLRPVVSLSQQRESSLYGASVPLFIKEQL